MENYLYLKDSMKKNSFKRRHFNLTIRGLGAGRESLTKLNKEVTIEMAGKSPRDGTVILNKPGRDND